MVAVRRRELLWAADFLSRVPRRAIAEALRLPDAYFDGFRAELRRKRDLLGDGCARPGSRSTSPRART